MQPEQALQTTGAAADNPAPGEVIPTKFVWTFGGRQVHVCGSFSAWVEAVPLAWEVHPEHPGGGYFAAVIPLAPGITPLPRSADETIRSQLRRGLASGLGPWAIFWGSGASVAQARTKKVSSGSLTTW